MPQWFRDALAEGIQRLIAIGLPGGPGWDSIKLTTQAWAEALWEAPVEWLEKPDKWRLETAFKRLARNSERWPTPKALIDTLPARSQPAALPAPSMSRTQREANSRRLRAALKEAMSRGK